MAYSQCGMSYGSYATSQNYTFRRPGRQKYTFRKPGRQKYTFRKPDRQKYTFRMPGRQYICENMCLYLCVCVR